MELVIFFFFPFHYDILALNLFIYDEFVTNSFSTQKKKETKQKRRRKQGVCFCFLKILHKNNLTDEAMRNGKG